MRNKMLSDILFVVAVLVFLSGTHSLCYLAGYKRGVEEVSDKDE